MEPDILKDVPSGLLGRANIAGERIPEAMDIGSLVFRTFAHATEDEGRVAQALRFVSGAEEFDTTRSAGYHGNPIVIMEAKVTESRKIKAFFQSLSKDDVRRLIDTLDRRVDDESFFFLRLDKQDAYRGKLVLADHDDVIAVRGKVRSYPQSKENALKAMHTMLGALTEGAASSR